MKLLKTFSRRLKTSRRLVIENIMDLDHVCVVHRRWFRKLRIVEWDHSRVDYRLESRFFGIVQEIAVSGAIIDDSHYWYEFNGRIASIRVDGAMTGPDGALLLEERVTYAFHWLLTPAFWLLAPLFQRQKEDILRDDTALLERAFELDRGGFRRSVDTGRPKVVVYFIAIAGRFGTSQGSMMVTVDGGGKTVSMALARGERGEIIPALLPSVAVKRLLSGALNARGMVPLHTWISRETFTGEMRTRGVSLFMRAGEQPWTEILQQAQPLN